MSLINALLQLTYTTPALITQAGKRRWSKRELPSILWYFRWLVGSAQERPYNNKHKKMAKKKNFC